MSYTYLIGWSKHNKWYYGVRFAKNCTPEELWKTYFTSSKYVKGFRNKFGDPDIVKIRKIFDNSLKARLWENKVLKKLNVTSDEKWLNKTDNFSILNTEETNKKTSERTKILKTGSKNPKLSYLNKLKKGDLNPSKNPKVREKLSVMKSGSNNHMYGMFGSLHPRYGSVGSAKDKKWYHDPINNIERYYKENTQPDNWVSGRLKRKGI